MTTSNTLGLRNIGPQTEEWLARIGIASRREFEKLGAEKTYLLLLEAGHPADLNLRYALIGAEQDLDWRIVAQKQKQRNKSRFADIDEP